MIKRVFKDVVGDIYNLRMFILALVVYNVVAQIIFHTFCPQLIFCGIPCPGCGMTRAVSSLLTGQFARAMAFNPCCVLWIVFAIYALVNRYVYRRRGRFFFAILVFAAISTILLYIYRMVTQFPGNPPMTYFENNIISRLRALF